MTGLSHLDAKGAAHMVDVGEKASTKREAIAEARLQTRPDVVAMISAGKIPKGDVLATARIAGIMAAKKTSELIPLCHPLALEKISIEFDCDATSGIITLQARCALHGKTGVEMEAMTAASVAALTLYDMCKAVDPAMVISAIHLCEKSGGKNGHWFAPNDGNMD
jgi:cyclic pyranopterin phosphate synthase